MAWSPFGDDESPPPRRSLGAPAASTRWEGTARSRTALTARPGRERALLLPSSGCPTWRGEVAGSSRWAVARSCTATRTTSPPAPLSRILGMTPMSLHALRFHRGGHDEPYQVRLDTEASGVGTDERVSCCAGHRLQEGIGQGERPSPTNTRDSQRRHRLAAGPAAGGLESRSGTTGDQLRSVASGASRIIPREDASDKDQFGGWNVKEINDALSKHVGLIIFTTILQGVAAFIWWGLPAGTDIWAVVAGYIVSAALGMAMGHQARDISQAIGVAWRVAAGWLLVWGVIEYIAAGQDTSVTFARFVDIFIGNALVIAGSYVLSQAMHAAIVSGKITLRDVLQAIGAVAAVAAVIVAIAQSSSQTDDSTVDVDQETFKASE